MGEEKGSMTQLLQHKFCLVRPVVSVVPGHFHYEESPNHRMLPLKVRPAQAQGVYYNSCTDYDTNCLNSCKTYKMTDTLMNMLDIPL